MGTSLSGNNHGIGANSLLAFAGRQSPYIAALAALNAIVWAIAEWTFHPIDGVSVWSALLLADTLLVVWWYADLTAGILQATTEAVAISRLERDDRQRPCVIVTQKLVVAAPSMPPAWLYVAENVGPGPALQVAFVMPRGETTDYVRLGPVGSGGYVIFPTRIQDVLRRAEPQFDTFRVVAQPLVGPEWCFYSGVMELSKNLSARVEYRVPEPSLVEELRSRSLDDLSEEAWSEIKGYTSGGAK
jgi:hypothetical protein